jgi:hypothetical protein
MYKHQPSKNNGTAIGNSTIAFSLRFCVFVIYVTFDKVSNDCTIFASLLLTMARVPFRFNPM